ncbi:MAG: acetylxylan esterase [Planctomycetota bacterium]|nr:acetylxylan esterase [Planctomycetota bacterium]
MIIHSRYLQIVLTVCGLLIFMEHAAKAQPRGYLYDEQKVPEFDLPDPLVFLDGTRVVNASGWEKRRQEIFEIFESQVYGRSPGKTGPVSVSDSSSTVILNGAAVLKQVRLKLTDGGPTVSVLIIRPAGEKKVPAFLGLNFMGNHTVFPHESIEVTTGWVRNDSKLGAVGNRASEKGRGGKSDRWPVQKIVEAGYALVTTYYGEIDPDFDDGFRNGIHGALPAGDSKRPAADEWGSIAGWAYGLSRILDCLETEDFLDAKKVTVLGHSRLGKTALWAGATDSRFAGVISNNSGCGGAALSKRTFGETVKRINTSFPHWFCDNFVQYNDRENELPVDQHLLIALSAPRPVYVASASKDLWADPRGEYLATRYASPVYKLLTGKGLGIREFPGNNQPSIGVLSYHCREGRHDLTPYDWENYIKFANQYSR